VLRPPQDPGIENVMWTARRYGGANDDLMLAVAPLCERLLAELDREIEHLQEAVREECRAELDALYKKAGLTPKL